MAVVNINISEPWYGYVVSGKKRIEGRLYKGKFASLAVGDTLCVNEVSQFKVAALRLYPSFRAMLSKEGIANVLPGVTSIKAGSAVYRAFYTEADEQQYGVVAIEVAYHKKHIKRTKSISSGQ